MKPKPQCKSTAHKYYSGTIVQCMKDEGHAGRHHWSNTQELNWEDDKSIKGGLTK